MGGWGGGMSTRAILVHVPTNYVIHDGNWTRFSARMSMLCCRRTGILDLSEREFY